MEGELFSREGYVFTGWNTKADGSGTAYEVGSSLDSVKDRITLYAQWEPAEDASLPLTDIIFSIILVVLIVIGVVAVIWYFIVLKRRKEE